MGWFCAGGVEAIVLTQPTTDRLRLLPAGACRLWGRGGDDGGATLACVHEV